MGHRKDYAQGAAIMQYGLFWGLLGNPMGHRRTSSACLQACESLVPKLINSGFINSAKWLMSALQTFRVNHPVTRAESLTTDSETCAASGKRTVPAHALATEPMAR